MTYSAFAKSLVETYTGFDEVALLTKRQNRLFELLSYDLEVAKFARENAVYNVQLDAAYSAEYPTVMDRLRYMFFAVGDQAPVRCHGLSPARVTSIPGFYENCNRIIVLNPYSNSGHISKKNFVYLERLAEYLTNYSNGGGFTVYTNVVKDQLPIRGTRELRCGLPEMLEIAAHIPCVISVRSGFLDFLVKTDVNMFVIYPKGGIKLQVYSMKDWKRNGIVEEVDIDDFFSDDKFERVDNFLRRIAADEKERKME